jgi:hypothetical protein
VLEEGDWRELTIALPSNDHQDFLSQRFVRYSATRVEAFGDAEEIHVLHSHKVTKGKTVVDEPLPRETFRHGTLEYDREVDQCAVAGSLLFVLGRWRDGQPEIYFPDEALGLYRLRFTSRTSLERLVGGIEQLRAMTGGSIAGLPLRLSLQFGEVADAGGAKRTVPYWSVRFLPPPNAGALTASTWLGFKAAAVAEDANLRALPPGAAQAVTAALAEAEGPDVDLDNPPPDPETVRRNAERYDQIFKAEDEVIDASSGTVNRATGEVLVESRPKRERPLEDLVVRYRERLDKAVAAGQIPVEDRAQWELPSDVTREVVLEKGMQLLDLEQLAAARPPDVTTRSALGQKLADLVEEAARIEVEFDDCKVGLPGAREQVIRAIEKLEERIDAKKRQLAGEVMTPADTTQEALV